MTIMTEYNKDRYVLNFVVENTNGKMEFRVTFESETLEYDYNTFKSAVMKYLESVFSDEFVANYLKFEVERVKNIK